jgi:hypothetical protein
MVLYLVYRYGFKTEERNSASRNDWLNKNKGPVIIQQHPIRLDREVEVTVIIPAMGITTGKAMPALLTSNPMTSTENPRRRTPNTRILQVFINYPEHSCNFI